MSTDAGSATEYIESAEDWTDWIAHEALQPPHTMATLDFDRLGDSLDSPTFEDPLFIREFSEREGSVAELQDYLRIVLGTDWHSFSSDNVEQFDRSCLSQQA